jgi:hypothetical protein
VQEKIERLVALAADSPGPMFEGSFRKQAETLEKRHAELERILVGRKAENTRREQRAQTIAVWRAQLADLPALWEEAPLMERNEMLRVAMDSVQVLPTRPRLKEFAVEWIPGV